MDLYYISCAVIFSINFSIFSLLLCNLIKLEKKTSKAMETYNFSSLNFNKKSSEDSLETNKVLQWNLVYYAMLLYGALYAISLLRLFENVWYRLILIAGALIVFDFGIYFVVELQYKMQQSRIIRMRHMNDFRIRHFWMTDSEINLLIKKNRKFWRDARISILLIVVQISAIIVFLYSLFEK